MDFDKAYDKLDWVRGQLESTVSNSRVELMPSDMGDFFITVTQRNETTGNDSTWSFCVNVDDNYVQMLEPTEDEEKFTNITEVYSIIKSFLQGGMSREKRRNMPEYNPGEPIKITGKGNKIGSSNKTVVRQGPNLKTLDETVPEHIIKNLDAYKGYTRYDMEELVLKPSGYILYDASNNGRDIVYKKRGATKDDNSIVLYFRNGELKNAEIKSSRKPIKSDWNKVDKKTLTNPEYPEYKIVKREWVNFRDIAYEWTIYKNNEPLYWKKVRGQDKYVNIPKQEYKNNYNAISGFKSLQKAIFALENYVQNEKEQTIESSHKPIKSSLSDVNKALGFTDNDIEEDGKIHITTDFGEFVVDYVNDEYIVSYDGEERIFTEYKDTVEEVVNLFNTLCNEEVEFFNKNINSSKSIKSDYSDEEYWYPETKKVYRLYKYDSNGNYYTWDYDTLEEAQRMKPRGNRYTTYNIKEVEVPVQSSRKPIKSAYFNPEEVFAYLVGGPADMITNEDKKQADEYNVVYVGYGIMDDGEKGHLFVGKYGDIENYIENYMGAAIAEEYVYSYMIDGRHITDSFQIIPTKPLPTEQDYKDFVNQLNAFVAENYETNPKYGPLYVFNMYKDDHMNNDGYGNEYPNFVIYDDEGNLDMHSDDSITEYIRQELEAKGWYPECVHSSSDFTIAIK